MKQVVLLILLFFCIPSGLAQESADHEKLVQRLEAFGRTIPQEKVYVHMDNTTYFLGDTIWFSAYTRQTNTGGPSNVSRVLYAELLNNDGYLVERKLIEMKDGRGNGFFALSEPLLYSGFYELRAYTRWQLNWGVYEHKHSFAARKWFTDKELEKKYYRDYHKLYSRVFPVYDRPKETGAMNRDMTLRSMRRYFKKEMMKRTPALSLYPEGGNLVAGVENRVAFEAVWSDGEWMEGWLHYGNDSVPVVHRGRGVFLLVPDDSSPREVYFRSKEGELVKAKLPDVNEAGVSVQLVCQENAASVHLRISSMLRPDSLALSVMHEGRLVAFHGICSRDTILCIPFDSLPCGVHQATVFDTQGRVYADRLFFAMKKEKDEPSLYITLPRRTYNPYEKIELEVAASKGKTPVSLSVRDAYGCDALFDNGNILTEMLLASEVKGFIPNPGWYFEKDDETHRRALDLLLMTQGWRRFNWKDMAIKGEWEITQPAEQKQILTGRVYKYSWNPQEILDVFILKQILKQEEDFLSDPDRRENGALKRDVKIHAELIHPQMGKAVMGEEKTFNGTFRIQLPGYYGHAIFFLSASDTTKWEKKEKHEWIKMAVHEEDRERMSLREQIRTYSPPEYTIRIEWPYPRFVKPYSFYQNHLIGFADTLEYPSGILAGNVTQMKEVTVYSKYGGLKKIDDSQPAFMVDAYDAVNQAIDAGLELADNPFVRTFIGDFGLDLPYKREVNFDAEALSSTDFKSSNIKVRCGLSPTRLALPQYIDIPKDSVYHPKYLRSFNPDAGLSNGEINEFRGLHRFDRFYIYSDFCPRKENSEEYHGSNLPETSIVVYPFADGSQRVTYRDRRYVLPGFAYPAEFYSPDYSKQTPPDSVKDYRRTLYWNPNLMLDENGKATVTLYNCSRTTQPIVETAGQAADGTLLWNE